MKRINGKMLSIIMPAYNEASHIRANLEETVRTLKGFNTSYEIIVIDDGSTDRTFQEALSVANHFADGRIIVKRNRSNFGKGRAIKKGFRYTQGEYVVFLDADLDLHPRQLETFFDLLFLTESDAVIGSKMHRNSKLEYPWYRRIMSVGYYGLVKLLFGLPLRDTQTGLKLFRRKVLDAVLPKIVIKKFAFDLEILALAHKQGFNITEAPVILTSQRIFGRLGLRAIWHTWVDTVAIFYRMYLLRYYDTAVSVKRPPIRRTREREFPVRSRRALPPAVYASPVISGKFTD